MFQIETHRIDAVGLPPTNGMVPLDPSMVSRAVAASMVAWYGRGLRLVP